MKHGAALCNGQAVHHPTCLQSMQNMQNPWGRSQIDGISILILPVLFLWESWRANSRTVSGALVLVSKREVISIAVKNFVNPPHV